MAESKICFYSHNTCLTALKVQGKFFLRSLRIKESLFKISYFKNEARKETFKYNYK